MNKPKFRLVVQIQKLDGSTEILRLNGRDAWSMEQLIDGRGCAGKSFLAQKLVAALDAGLTGSDDFFLAMPKSDDLALGLQAVVMS